MAEKKEKTIKTTISIRPSQLQQGRRLAFLAGRSFSNYLANYISEQNEKQNAKILS